MDRSTSSFLRRIRKKLEFGDDEDSVGAGVEDAVEEMGLVGNGVGSGDNEPVFVGGFGRQVGIGEVVFVKAVGVGEAVCVAASVAVLDVETRIVLKVKEKVGVGAT